MEYRKIGMMEKGEKEEWNGMKEWKHVKVTSSGFHCIKTVSVFRVSHCYSDSGHGLVVESQKPP